MEYYKNLIWLKVYVKTYVSEMSCLIKMQVPIVINQ